MTPGVEQFISSQGTRIYRIPLSLFPGMEGFSHLIIQGDSVDLFDVGSGFGESNHGLDSGMQQIADRFGEKISWADIEHVFISHAHIDHYGGLHFIRERTDAPIVIHELERRVLTDYENRLNLVAARLEQYLIEAGLSDAELQEVMDLYLLHKHLFSSIEIQTTYEELGMQSGVMRFEHVPGHCPGHVMAWVDDILLAGDHILKETSPHQAPESLSLNMGLEHYLDSLTQLLPRASDATWTLGGHEGPIADLVGRIVQIAEVHRDRLQAIHGLLDRPMTLHEITAQLFPVTEGYHRLLALEESGAHVEYLLLRGYVAFTQDAHQVKHYSRLSDDTPAFPGLGQFVHPFNSATAPRLRAEIATKVKMGEAKKE